MKLRIEDEVIVISGKDKGKIGKIIRVDLAKQKVFVEGLNIVKRHQRPSQVPNARAQQVGGVIESRPLSRTKRWRLIEITERAK